jgi:hypothetical protein
MLVKFVVALLVTSTLAACIGDDPELDTDELAVLGGTNEPNYRYPWVVNIPSCRGVLIHPSFVLTAAHCVNGSLQLSVSYSRKDPFTGTVYTDSEVGNAIVHEDFELTTGNGVKNDIAIIVLQHPFVLDRGIQTVALPTLDAALGEVGVIASIQRNDGSDGADPGDAPPLQDGELAVVRGPITDGNTCHPTDASQQFCVQASDAGVCEGDSGSGFVRTIGSSFFDSGRATVVGVTSQTIEANCIDVSYVNRPITLTDVFAYRDWIAEKTGLSLNQLAGDAHIRWGGTASRGTMTIRCENGPTPARRADAPMNVAGVEARLASNWGDQIRAICDLRDQSTARVTGFTLRKTNRVTGAVTTTALGYTASYASYVTASDTTGATVFDFVCKVSPIPIGG